MMNDYRYLEDYYEAESLNNYNVDLSHIPNEQRYLKIQGSDTDLIEISTTGHQQYFGKLKTLEVNGAGDLVMTMKSSNNSAFQSKITDFSSAGNLLLPSDKHIACNEGDNRQKQQITKEFVKIDGALANIFNNLRIKV